MSKSKKINCHCNKWARCKLCDGAGKYEYTPGTRGYIPFQCTTCEGKRVLIEDGEEIPCLTCKELGSVDPANPPPSGMLDVLVKILFGA